MKRFLFEPLSELDLEWAMHLHNDPEVLENLSDPRPVSWHDQTKWFQSLQYSNKSKRLVVLERTEKIGLIRLDQIDYQNKSICIGMDIEKDFRGKGFAKPIYKQLLDQLFTEQGFNRVWLLVAEYNKRAMHIYSSVGFKEEGKQEKSLLKNNQYFDMIMMRILKDEYVI